MARIITGVNFVHREVRAPEEGLLRELAMNVSEEPRPSEFCAKTDGTDSDQEVAPRYPDHSIVQLLRRGERFDLIDLLLGPADRAEKALQDFKVRLLEISASHF